MNTEKCDSQEPELARVIAEAEQFAGQLQELVVKVTRAVDNLRGPQPDVADVAPKDPREKATCYISRLNDSNINISNQISSLHEKLTALLELV